MANTSKEHFREVQYRMDDEGFHYCFNSYSHFPEIQDENFHKLRLAYLKAAEELEDYVNKQAEDE
jgi:hypothetical protein